MNTKIILGTFIAAIFLSTTTLRAEQPKPRSINVQERMRAIDLKILLKQYKKVRRALEDVRFQERMSTLTPNGGKELAIQSQREDLLTQELDQLQTRIRQLANHESQKAKGSPEKNK